jgi:hypothetical protein
MEKVAQYKKIGREIIQFIRDALSGDDSISIQAIMDEENGHYLVFNNGWRDSKHRVYGCVVHIEVKPEGKIWLHHDGTDMIVGQMLLDKGIPKSDIVIGFHAPIMRKDTEFAVG